MRQRSLKALMLVLVVVLPFARMFLGVHTPIDIITGFIVVIAVCLVNYKILAWSRESERNRTYALVGYMIFAIAVAVACDLLSGKVLSNNMAGFGVAVPLCMLIEERYVGYEVPSGSVRDRFVSAMPGFVICLALSEALYCLLPAYNIFISTTVAAVFVVLVYPYFAKRYLAGDAAD